jgi:parallel beta-helix repeat protein
LKKLSSGIVLALLLASTLTVALYVQPVRADYLWTETIHIRADGSIYPNATPISSADNVTYRLTDNVVGEVPTHTSAIIIERDNIIVDGAGYTLNGSGLHYNFGFNLTGINNVAIKNMTITNFGMGIILLSSSNNSISGNNITASNGNSIRLFNSSDNRITGNNITNNEQSIDIDNSSSNNNVTGNSFVMTAYSRMIPLGMCLLGTW